MDARTLQRLGFSVLVAALAAALPSGCAPLRGTRFDPITPTTTPLMNVGEADGFASGTVVSASGSAPAPPATIVQAAQPGAPAPDPLAAPRPLPPTPGMPTPVAPGVPVPGPPMMVPPAAPNGTKLVHPPGDPHVRNTPTATGARLALAPHEMSTDRIVELTLHLERLVNQNQALAAKIKELENAGGGREQALEEAARAIAAGTAEAEKTRATLQAQVVSLQGKVKQLEEEDIAFLRAVIDALNRLAPPEKKP